MARSRTGRSDSAQRVVEQVADRFGRQEALAWLYGQGSVITGFSTDSDLDFVAVWHRMPTAAVMPGGSGFARHGELALEQLRMGGYDVDVQHVPSAMFEQWIEAVGRGEGWSGEQWPMPSHVAAGLAEGLLVVDSSGAGAELQAQLQQPEPVLVEAVVGQLSAAAPGLLSEMERASSRHDLWLHDLLAVQLHKMIYTAWFLIEGHYPPFPKHLCNWYQRFGMDDRVRQLEERYWATTDQRDRRSALAELTSTVLALRPLPAR
jgi:hypothetical protein